MDKDRIAGAAKEAEGTIKTQVGKLTDTPKLEAEGKIRKAEGSLQKAFGRAKDKLRNL